MTKKHAGKTVLITGGASGIGLAIAERFQAEGASLALFDLSQEALDRAREKLSQSGPAPLTFAGSVAEPRDVEDCFAALDSQMPGLDVLINCAGVLVVKPAVELAVEDWKRSIDINLTGTWLTCQAAGRRMVAAGKGAIVNISSVMGNGGAPERTGYCASKAGVIGLTKSLAVEWGRYGVRVNSLAPTATRTDLVQNLIDQGIFDMEGIRGRTPLQRMAEPAEVAAVCSFLASEDAAMVSGHDMAVDGGWMANTYV
ncbi:MAG: SDR family NAD(P)-dependent oxidoreductase [Rhodovibrionaceae bacterium]